MQLRYNGIDLVHISDVNKARTLKAKAKANP